MNLNLFKVKRFGNDDFERTAPCIGNPHDMSQC